MCTILYSTLYFSYPVDQVNRNPQKCYNRNAHLHFYHDTTARNESTDRRPIIPTTTVPLNNRSMTIESSEKENAEAKLKQYATFIDQTLHPELKKRVEAREEIEHEMNEYRDLSAKLQALNSSSSSMPKAMVDLGHQTAYCEAVLTTTTTSALKLYVHIGMGFHAEMTVPEALAFCDERLLFLSRVLTQRADSAMQVARHLKSSLLLLEQLANEVGGRTV